MTERSAPVPGVKNRSRKRTSSQSGGQQGRRRRASQRPRTLAEWGLASILDGDQRGPVIFARIDTMTSTAELAELWRSIAASLSADSPLAWPFDRGDPTLEEAQGAVVCLARLAMGNAEALVWIYGKEDGWRTRYRERMALVLEAKEHAARRNGAISRHGGTAGEVWRSKRDELVHEYDQRLRRDYPTMTQTERCKRIAEGLSAAQLTPRNILRILTTAHVYTS